MADPTSYPTSHPTCKPAPGLRLRSRCFALGQRQLLLRTFDPDFLVDEGVIAPEDRDLFCYAETAEVIRDDITRRHDRAGRPLAGPAAERKTP